MDERQRKFDLVQELHGNLTAMVEKVGTPEYDPVKAVELLEAYSKAIPDARKTPDEIKWDMLNAQAFITSVQTSTGTVHSFTFENYEV